MRMIIFFSRYEHESELFVIRVSAKPHSLPPSPSAKAKDPPRPHHYTLTRTRARIEREQRLDGRRRRRKNHHHSEQRKRVRSPAFPACDEHACTRFSACTLRRKATHARSAMCVRCAYVSARARRTRGCSPLQLPQNDNIIFGGF